MQNTMKVSFLVVAMMLTACGEDDTELVVIDNDESQAEQGIFLAAVEPVVACPAGYTPNSVRGTSYFGGVDCQGIEYTLDVGKSWDGQGCSKNDLVNGGTRVIQAQRKKTGFCTNFPGGATFGGLHRISR